MKTFTVVTTNNKKYTKKSVKHVMVNIFQIHDNTRLNIIQSILSMRSTKTSSLNIIFCCLKGLLYMYNQKMTAGLVCASPQGLHDTNTILTVLCNKWAIKLQLKGNLLDLEPR